MRTSTCFASLKVSLLQLTERTSERGERGARRSRPGDPSPGASFGQEDSSSAINARMSSSEPPAGILISFVPRRRTTFARPFALKKSFKSVCGTGDPLPAPRRRESVEA